MENLGIAAAQAAKPLRIELIGRAIKRRRITVDAEAIATRLVVLGWPQRQP